MMGKKVLAAKSGRASCSCAAAGGGIAAKNAKGAKSFLTGLTGFTGLREASVKPTKTKPSGVAWIGDIPDGWEVVPARHIFEEVTAKNKNGQYTRQLSFRYGEIVDKGPNQSHNASPEETILTYTIVEPDTIMINGLNLNYDLLSLRVAIVKEIGIITSAYLAVVPQGSRIIPLYALYLLKAYDFKMVFHGQGSGIRMTLKFADFAALPIVLPPLIEQKAIAAYLDEKCGAIDAAVAEAKKGIEEYKAWKKSLIFELVTGKRRVGVFNAETRCARDEVVGLPERSEPEGPQGAARRREAEKMKPSGIPWIGTIPEGWAMVKASKIFSVITDFVASGSFADLRENVKYLDYPDYAQLIRTADVSGKSHELKPVYISKESYDFLSGSNLYGGELLLPNIGASVGDVYIVPRLYERMSLAPNAIMVKNSSCDKFYFYFFSCDSGRLALEDIAESTAQPKFNKTDFRNLRLPAPATEEQQAIANYLDDKCAAIDAMVAEKEALIADLEAYKKSLIYETVTGKREVA